MADDSAVVSAEGGTSCQSILCGDISGSGREEAIVGGRYLPVWCEGVAVVTSGRW
jgi:hypothetical protein